MDSNHRWETLFPFLLPCLTKRKNCTVRQSVMHNILKKYSKKKSVLKQCRQQDHKIAIRLYKHKTKSYIFFFYFQNLFLWFKKLLDTDIYFLWSIWAQIGQSEIKARVQTCFNSITNLISNHAGFIAVLLLFT